MFNRILDKFLEVALDTLQTSNIAPSNVGHFDDSLTKRRWITLRQSMTKVILTDRHGIQNFGVNGLIFNINEIHLFANALHGCFGTERRNVGSDKTVSFTSNRFWLHVFVELHVARVDAKDFEATVLVGDTDINFSIKATESSQGGINGIGAVGGTNDHNAGALLEAVHESQHLRYNTAFDFAIGLITLGSNGINLINENNGRSILFCLFKSFAKV
mmetsp:Transcript_15479/g.25816  ORF Transcript_15479/g.25816 Transcript_15479/m.25816 type:complete len:216 (+) Transcript_15479:1082-1729(+)